jgi:phospholipid/cholesterol/gamma-HCH transport system substrate-binding protein
MDERVMQFRVGVFFLATLLLTAILLVMFGKLPNLAGRYYTVYVRFDDAAGVSRDTPIRKSGILIGRVADVQLTDRESSVLVTAKIQADKTIYQNEKCYITRNLISGDSALTFLAETKKPGEKPVEKIPITPDSEIQGYVSEDPTGLKGELQKPINKVSETGDALKKASEQLSRAARRVEDILTPETQKDVQKFMHDAAKSMASIREVLGDDENRQKLAEAIQRLPKTLDNMSATFHATDETLRKFTDRAAADGKTPIERMVGTIEMTERTMRKFSEPAREGELSPAEQLAKSMENIGEISEIVQAIMERIDRGEGSLGALISDRQLYDRLGRAAKNIEEISYRLKPIVEDARVFTDKVARHPGVIVRDAVKPGVGIK